MLFLQGTARQRNQRISRPGQTNALRHENLQTAAQKISEPHPRDGNDESGKSVFNIYYSRALSLIYHPGLYASSWWCWSWWWTWWAWSSSLDPLLAIFNILSSAGLDDGEESPAEASSLSSALCKRSSFIALRRAIYSSTIQVKQLENT